MKQFDILCPSCGKTLTVRKEWVGKVSACPACSKKFIVPEAPSRLEEYSLAESPEPEMQTTIPLRKRVLRRVLRSDDVWVSKKNWLLITCETIFGLVVIAAGIYILSLFCKGVTAPSQIMFDGNQLEVSIPQPKMLQGVVFKIEDIAKEQFFPKAAGNRKFFYRGSSFTGITLKAESKEIHTGSVEFTRNGQACRRPLVVRSKGLFSHYFLNVKYENHSDYLEQDADLIFALAVQTDPELKGAQYISGTVISPGVLRCRGTLGKKPITLDIEAKQSAGQDGIPRIVVKVEKKGI